MRYFILILLSFTVFAAEGDKPKPQPIEVIQALASYEKGLIEARKRYEAEEGKLRLEAVRKLEEAKKSYARREDLDGGVLCQEGVKKFKSGEVMVEVEGKYKENMNVFGGKIENVIIGRWKVDWGTGSSIQEFMSDGTVLSGSETVKWSIVKDAIVVNWPGNHDIIKLKNGVICGVNARGNILSYTKIEK